MSDTAVDAKRLTRVTRCFDGTGRLLRWPSKRAEQILALWAVWWFLPTDLRCSEPELNAMLRGWNGYEDYALLRRDMVDLGLLQRTPNGSVYRKVNQEVPPEAAALIARFDPAVTAASDL